MKLTATMLQKFWIALCIPCVVEGATLTGTAGIDILSAPDGEENIMFGLGGDDVMFGGDGSTNNMDGGDGDDRMFGGDQGSMNNMDGGVGNDSMFGGDGGSTNYMDGGDGDDDMFGGDGGSTNYMDGGDGNESLFAGGGTDIMTGGPGNDLFNIRLYSEPADFGDTTITDFNTDEDSLRLQRCLIPFDYTATMYHKGYDTIISFERDSNGDNPTTLVLEGVHVSLPALVQQSFASAENCGSLNYKVTYNCKLKPRWLRYLVTANCYLAAYQIGNGTPCECA